jgi:predicted dehydrogenase
MEILFWMTLFALPSASRAWVLLPSLVLDQRSAIIMPPNAVDVVLIDRSVDGGGKVLRCGILGCGMMGQEHCSYIAGYPQDLRIDFLCDPNEPSLTKCLKTLKDFAPTDQEFVPPTLVDSEDELLQHVHDIDLLVIASPNYMHTGSLVRWSQFDITILVEKPVAISQPQIDILRQVDFKARIWVAMEYRFMPAIAKLLKEIPTVGEVKMVTIRENRFPFLLKVGNWNRDLNKTGDSLVEKWYVIS